MKKIIIFILKFRFAAIIILALELILKQTYYRNLLELSDTANQLVKQIFLESSIIRTILANLTIILSNDYVLLYESIVSVTCFILILIIISLLIKRLSKKYLRVNSYKLLTFLVFILVSFVYFFLIRSFEASLSAFLLGYLVLLYYFNFYLYESDDLFESSSFKYILLAFFSIFVFISEILFLPLYNKLLLVLKNKQHDQKKLEFFRYAHFSLILFTTIVLVSPISSPKIIPMHKLQSGSYYDVKYSIREGKLFALNQCKQQIEVFTLDGNNFPQIIYKPNYKRESGWNIGHFISLNDDRRELYFTDRARQELIIMDTSDYSVKKAIKSDFVDSGDNYLVSGDNTIYGLTEDYLCVYKINLNSDSNNILFRCLFDGEGAFMEINKTKELLYIMNWKTPSLEYSIYVLDANNLSFHKKHTAPLSGMMITSTNNKIIYQNISNELRILDADSFSIIDRFKLPFTTQDTIFDEKRQLLFAGNFFTGIINIIDLKTKNTISYQRCSDCYTRRIALDTKTRRFFVATYSGGVCVGNY